MIGLLVIVACGILILKIYNYRKRFLRALETIPGPTGLPFLGNAAELAFCDTAEFHEKLEVWVNQFGTRVKIDMFNKFWILHSSPEDIEKIATSNSFNRKSVDYDFLQEWLGNGILLDHGSSWFKNRKALTDAFHFKVLENFIPTSQEQSQILVDKLLSFEGKTVDIFPVMKLYTLDVILETAMGVKCGAQLNDSEYVRAVSRLSHITYWRMCNVMGFADATFRLTKHYRPYCEMLKVSNDFTMDVIRRRRDELQNEFFDKQQSNPADEGPKKRYALLDKLLQMEVDGRKLTDQEIQSQVNNFMFAEALLVPIDDAAKCSEQDDDEDLQEIDELTEPMDETEKSSEEDNEEELLEVKSSTCNTPGMRKDLEPLLPTTDEQNEETGHDTTSSALTFITFLIAKHPKVQEKLYEEVKSVVRDARNPEFNSSMLNDLKYMDSVIKESLRMYTPVPYFSRTVEAEAELFGVTYPPGTTVTLAAYFMHRNPKYFPEPTRFKPERFDPDVDAGKRNPYVYVPFSAGSRNCIGQKFAMYELKVALSYIVLRCRAELEDLDYEPRLKTELILKPAGGMPVRFFART